MAEHKITILNRITIPEAGIELVCNNPTDTIRFEFDDEWSGIAAKTARFSWDGKYIDKPFSGNVVDVPEIYQTNHVYVGVFADNIASTPAKVKARYSIKCLGGKVVPPSEDVYAEIIALINAGINANDGVGVSSAYLGENGHLFIVLTTGESIDCGKAQGRNGNDGKDGKDGAGAEEFAAVLKSIEEHKVAIEQNATEISALETDLNAFEKERSFNLTGNPVQVETFEGMPLNLVTILEPKQEGSGDPYPAGGGRNKSIPFSPGTHNGVTFVVNGDGSVNVSGTATAETALINEFYIPAGSYVISGAPSGSSFAKYDMYIAQMHGDTGDNGTVVARSFDGTTETNFSFDTRSRIRFIIRIPAGAVDSTKVFYPMIRLASDTDTSYAPPSNIRSISGYDALGLTRCGDNLLNYDMWKYIGVHNGTGVFENNGVTITANNDDAYTVDGLGWPDVEDAYFAKILVNPGESITLSWEADRSYSANIYIFPNADLEGLVVCNNVENRPLVYTATAGVSFVTIRFSATKAGDVISYRNIMVNKGTEAMPFKPWQGKTNTVQIGQTVYGGRMDWTTGKLTVTWAAIDGGSRNWSVYEDSGVTVFLTDGAPAKIYGAFNVISSHYKTSKNALVSQMGNMEIKGSQSSNAIFVRDTRYTDPAAFKTAMNGVQICYMLEKPIEIQLEPHEINSLQGVNTLYGDGEITISGRSDMQAVVSNLMRRIAALETTINS